MTKIGILRAGQLASMLAVEAGQLGFEVYVFAFSPFDPAISVADHSFISNYGPRYHHDDLKAFLLNVDIGIFENELLTENDYQFITNELKIPVFPNVDCMNICSDKAKQKEMFGQLGVSSAKYMNFNPSQSVKEVWETLQTSLPDGVMLKWAKGGYDGYGVRLVRQDDFHHHTKKEEAFSFIQACFDKGYHLYGEELVAFEKEFALVTTRGINGEMAFYPLVETIQEDGICRTVRFQLLDSKLIEQARQAAQKISEHLGFVGTFAIEFFQTPKGLLVNELAPRVHNSGHCTLNSSRTSQFKNHILAVTRNQLGSTESLDHFAMVNILGPLKFHGSIEAPNFSDEFVQLYWYEKNDSKPGRKMGHLNIWADSEAKLSMRVDSYLNKIKVWERQFVEEK